jgi:Subtilase family.
VPVADVAVDDLTEIADLPFVLQLNHDPEIEGVRRTDVTSEVTASSTPTADDLRSSDHNNFDAVSASTDVKLGGFIGGYSDSGPAYYGENWAETVGIDTGTAKDFTDTEGWRGSQGTDHGTGVLNTAAYFLKPFATSDSQLVPLRVFNSEKQGDVYASVVGNAIDHAIVNDVAVGVCSLIITHNVSACPSTVCAELDSYASAGYTMAVASGSEDPNGSVDDPASSYFTVGVGAYEGRKQDGFDRYENSQYTYVDYYNSYYDFPECAWCNEDGPYKKFCPDVYAHGAFSPTYNTSATIGATSMAAPIVSAGSAIDLSNNAGNSYETRLQRYQEMNQHPVYPNKCSRLGEVFYAPDID